MYNDFLTFGMKKKIYTGICQVLIVFGPLLSYNYIGAGHKIHAINM